MAIKVLKFEEIEQDITNSDYKRVGLFDSKGERLISFNSKSTDLSVRLNEIRKRLDSTAMPDGIYQIQAKHWGNADQPSYFYVNVGDIDTSLKDIEIDKPNKVEIVNTPVVGTITADKYNDLYREKIEVESLNREFVNANEELAKENTRLNKELDELNAEFEKVESEVPEEGFLNDTTKQFFSSSIEQLIPLADKYFEQKDKRLAMEELALKMDILKAQGINPVQPTGQPPVQQQVQPNNLQQHNNEQQPVNELADEVSEEEEVWIDAMEHLKQSDPKMYELAMGKLADHYQSQGGGAAS